LGEPLKRRVGFLTLKMRKAVLVFGVIMFLLVVCVEVSACSCDADPPTATTKQLVAVALSGARAVFAGKVVAIEKRSNLLRVLFKVDRTWKGKVFSRMLVTTGRGGGDCGFHFRIGRLYLVYAGLAVGNTLGTSICHRTGSLSERANDLRSLGAPLRSFEPRRAVRS